MLQVINKWFQRVFAEEEAVYLFFFLCLLSLSVILLGKILAPVFAALVIAYLLQGLVNYFDEKGLEKTVSFYLVFFFSIGFLVFLFLFLIPLIWNQLVNFVNNQLPSLATSGESVLRRMQEKFPDLVSAQQVSDWTNMVTSELGQMSQSVLTFSIASLPNVFEIMIFLILVPILVFFFLKDKQKLVDWLVGYLPEKRKLMSAIWLEMDQQISNYVQGKAIEIIIVSLVTYIAFFFLDLNYALLLAISVGLSVIIPYVGAVIVTLPVTLVAYIQFGFTAEFGQVMLVYFVIQILDGNFLVPLLFSEAVNLHPVAIIVAILFFGGIWGLWGVFFAIPLATLIKAVLHAWPSIEKGDKGADESGSCEQESVS